MKKSNYVTVYTMGELVQAMNSNTSFVRKCIGKLQGADRRLALFTGIALACAVVSEFKRRHLEEELYRLSVRVKKLERSEEE